MVKRVVINPVTRLSGFMELEVWIENHRVVEARTKGMLFRGFEQMMVGRNPFDAIYLTQRICGICSSAHSVASSTALEAALQIRPTEQGRYLRDIIHGCEFLQNHIRHFYQYSLPDFVKMPEAYPLYQNEQQDYRLPKRLNDRLVQHYLDSLPISRNAHTMLAVLGGKAPHNHGIFVGGGTRPATVDKMIQMKSILAEIQAFIEEVMIPDAYTIAEYYDEYFTFGRGLGNFLCMGAFANYEELGTLYVDAGVYKDGEFAPFDPLGISESIAYSWYAGQESYTPFETIPEPDRNQSAAYSWVKAPRYEGLPFEVGPLARLWLAGEYRHGISAMDRSIARVLEAKKITEVLTILLEHLALDVTGQKVWKLPQQGEGAGLVETTRGSLGHWLKIEDQKLSFYQIITPSAWDFSARTVENRGTAEQALIGTPIQDPDHPIELGRIIRSFDPCMSCATHVYQPHKPPLYQKVQGT
ncbi:nickel-dependent hydrogenase large subunit [Rubeoparvulum massiliense]|uniref:nickel-dependent hydrogenase large subunit n=1 Tax=Rubeoparvulum massiliense TaxID=1631346 RepID=UPI00065E656A|nr:nickel-dependent hydrogenase large subunit [Rubeoparvulum massiliense]